MSTPASPVPSENRRRHWLRVLRPLGWWVLLVLVLYGYRTHQRLSQETRLVFSVVLDGKGSVSEATSTLDGHPVKSGERVQVGRQTFTVSHPKYEPYASNLFLYGERHLGEIVLKRSTGVLALAIEPPARLLTIRGSEFARTLSNSSGMTSSVPTDHYVVEATYAHWDNRDEILVSSGLPITRRLTSRLGSLQLACNQEEAEFQLLTTNDRLLQAGSFPDTVSELPEGTYKVLARHRGNQREEYVSIEAGTIGSVRIDFAYGTAVLESDPPGATVVGRDARELGVTPLTLSRLEAGTWEFTLLRQGREPVPASLRITADETNTFRADLVNHATYAEAISAARQFLADQDYVRAGKAAETALREKPNDPAASVMQNEVIAKTNLRLAEYFASIGKYTAAMSSLESVLQVDPENARAKELLSELTRRQAGPEDETRRMELK